MFAGYSHFLAERPAWLGTPVSLPFLSDSDTIPHLIHLHCFSLKVESQVRKDLQGVPRDW